MNSVYIFLLFVWTCVCKEESINVAALRERSPRLDAATMKEEDMVCNPPRINGARIVISIISIGYLVCCVS